MLDLEASLQHPDRWLVASDDQSTQDLIQSLPSLSGALIEDEPAAKPQVLLDAGD